MARRTLAILFLIGGVLLLALIAFLYLTGGFGGDDTPDVIDVPTPGVEVGEGTPVPEEVQQVPSGTTQTGQVSELVGVVVSLQTVPRGWRMTEDELAIDTRRADEVGRNVITNIEDAVGLYARTDIFQGETLTYDSLIEDPTLVGVEDYGPSSLIPEGYVAQGVPMDRLSSVAYGLAPGDYVDVMATFLIYEIDEEFQTLLENSGYFVLQPVSSGEEDAPLEKPRTEGIEPFGRFETLPNNDLVFITPSEDQRPIQVSFVLQGAKVIQVGPYFPPDIVVMPTATPTPDPNATPTPQAGVVPTPTPLPPDVVVLAMTPQQQLVMKYAIESAANIDYALRGPDDGQVYAIENVDLNYFLRRFNIEPPIDYGYTVSPVFATVTPAAPVPSESAGGE
jgi:Flp pilus assembly protein CpaB